MNTYSVIVLGASGSGKTVFLASMYKRLSIQRIETRFFLDIEPEKQRTLNKKYQEIADPNPTLWPEPTKRADISEWKFTCCVQKPGEQPQIYPALQVVYLDYAGEKITEPQGGASQDDFDKKILNADALLGILDGQKILSLMKGEDEGTYFIINDLTTILQDMQRSQAPVHFVITKWDLLEDQYTLQQIRDRLLEDDGFQQFVQTRINSNNISVRLIPVSAVGKGFARLQPDGSMQKIRGKLPKPFYVEMPFACVLPDQFQLQLERLKAQEEVIRNQLIRPTTEVTAWDKAGIRVGRIARFFRGFLSGTYQFEDAILERLIEFVESGARKKREKIKEETERLRKEREASLLSVHDEKSALELALRSFMFLVHELETKYPESDLRRVR